MAILVLATGRELDLSVEHAKALHRERMIVPFGFVKAQDAYTIAPDTSLEHLFKRLYDLDMIDVRLPYGT